MKNVKKLLALGLAVTMTASMLTGCGSSNDGAADADTNAKTDAEATDAEATDTEASADDKTASAEGGSVYYLNFKPEQDPQWQELAAKYTEETGVDVTVVTAASGEYETTLMSEMGSR